MDEFEGPERQLPPRARFYSEALEQFERLRAETEAAAVERTGKRPITLNYLGLDKNRKLVALPQIGADEIALEAIKYFNQDEDKAGETGTELQHDFIQIDLDLFNDGSPYVLEGDELDRNLANRYFIRLGREMAPEITQFQPDSSGNKHQLSDIECERLINALKTTNPDLEEELREANLEQPESD